MKKSFGKVNVSGKRSNANVSIAGSQNSFGGHRQVSIRASKGILYMSNSRKNAAIDEKSQKGANQKPPVQVFDDMGQDVTPRNLFQGDTSTQRKNQNGMMVGDSSSIGTPSTDFLSQSIYGASTMQASYAQGFTRSMMGSVMGASSRVSLDSINDEITEPSHAQDFSAGLADIQTRRVYVKEELSKEDLDKMVPVKLTETDTIWHLNLPGTSVFKDSECAQDVKKQNERYEELLKNRAGNDTFVQRGMQTYNNAPKHKELQTIPVQKQETGCMATTWDLYDTYAKDETRTDGKKTADLIESLSRPTSATANGDAETLPTVIEGGGDSTLTSLRKSSSIQSLMTESKASFMTTSNQSDSGDITDRESVSQATIDLQAEKILKLDSMKKNLFILERAIMQNIFHPKQAAYRGLPPVSDSSKDADVGKEENEIKLGANLARLWAYSCSLTRGKRVNSLTWNKANKDLLAVGYGNYGSSEKDDGLVCCWSLKNPEYPERVYRLHSAVTAIDFSSEFPNLLAVGLYDGGIAILNVRSTTDSSVLDSFDSHGKQSGPIWQLRWIYRDMGTGEDKGGEVMVSSSADGRVTQWSIRKGFEYQDLMKLKKMNISKQIGKSPAKGEGKKGDALISRYVAAMCFDFHPSDGNLYLAATEEGNIHKCSCSYNEQFLETYAAHSGPVYKVIWCPFLADAFISCSADWSIRIWHQDRPVPSITLQSAQEAVHDIDWSPKSATVIGAVNDTQVEIWDLSYSTLDPLIVNVSVDSNLKLTSIIFSLDADTVLVGDSEGNVTVFQLRAMPPTSPQQTGILSKIIQISSGEDKNGSEAGSYEDDRLETADR